MEFFREFCTANTLM
ncbi:hypothetical protein A2U01_0119203, partial [Trifolium medium]|nr:hypothetical protein [Trifolium medium]